MQRFLFILIVTFFGLFLIIICVQVFAPKTSKTNDPFLANPDEFIGHSVNSLEARGFSCSALPVYTSTSSMQRDWHCNVSPASNIVSYMELVSIENIAYQIIFTMQENAIRVGNLMTRWGEPEIQRRPRAAFLSWHSLDIIAVVPYESGGYSASLAVHSIYYFDKSSNNLWDRNQIVPTHTKPEHYWEAHLQDQG